MSDWQRCRVWSVSPCRLSGWCGIWLIETLFRCCYSFTGLRTVGAFARHQSSSGTSPVKRNLGWASWWVVLTKANTGDRWRGRRLKRGWSLGGQHGGEEGSWREAGLEWRGGTAAVGGRGGAGAQKLPWTKGWLRSTSAVGRHFSSTNTCRRKSLHASVTPSGSMGFVGCVAILNMAAMASYSAHGGFWVSISTTVQATLLYTESLFNWNKYCLTCSIWVIKGFYYCNFMNRVRKQQKYFSAPVLTALFTQEYAP